MGSRLLNGSYYPTRTWFGFPRWIAATGLALVVVGLFYWFFVGVWADASSRLWQWFTRMFLAGGFFPGGLNPIHFTAWTWLLLGLVVVVVGFFFDRMDSPTRTTSLALWVVGAIMISSSVYVWAIGINNHSGSYASGTTFIVEDPANPPQSLKRLLDDTQPDTNGCALYAHNDMRGCINKGSFDFEWDSRQASATGARTVIARSGGSVQNTQLLDDSLSYIYGQGDRGVWTAIRDGNKRNGVYGVLSYDGTGNVQPCKFDGENDLNKGFNSTWGHNLADDIANHYPDLF